MNKDVIYIEPENDITDIIAKIEGSKQKIVALVPPKKAGVFRSMVNIKLITKAATGAKKTVVLVTTDPSIMKLAAATKLPVTKDLKSAPEILDPDTEIESTAKEDVDEGDEDNEDAESKEETEDKESTDDDTEEDAEEDSEDDDDKEEKPKKEAKKSENKIVAWIQEHKKLSIFAGIGGVLLIILLVWMFAIAPAVDVFVSIKTDANNFSEAVSFVKVQTQEDIKENKLYLEERKVETANEVEFEATGQKNVGEKATGNVVVYARFKDEGTVFIKGGSSFTVSGLTYYSDSDAYIVSKGFDSCPDSVTKGEYRTIGCIVSARIKVTAAEPGTKYNISAKGEDAGWDTTANVYVYSDQPMLGGTDEMKTIVSAEDIEKAKNELNSDNTTENREKLYKTISDDNLIVESTFRQETADAVATPGVGEEVTEGTKPTLKAVTTTSVYTIDKTKLEELIRSKVDLPEDKKIFEIRNVYVDSFKESDDGFSGKLKAVYFTGPRITEGELVEKIKGKGLGDARREVKDIDGVADVKMDPSYPWVMSVPSDSNKITMTFEIKDQNGQKIEEKQPQESTDPEEETE